MGLRLPELLVILVIVVLIFGAGKLPQLGDALGRGIRNFKKATGNEEPQAGGTEAKAEKKTD